MRKYLRININIQYEPQFTAPSQPEDTIHGVWL